MRKYLKTHERILNKLFYVAAALPIIFIALFILRYGVNVPTFDQWELVPYIEKLDAGTLSFTNLLAQHNEHRLFFPRITMLGLGHITHWNTVAEMFFSLGVQVLTFVLIWKAIKRTFGGWTAKVCILLASALLFNPMQWENWLWGWQLQWYLTIFGMVAALYFAWYLPMKRRQINHVLAIAGATLATFSLGGGLVTWIILLVLLALRRQITALAVYMIAFLGEAAIYLHNYHSVAGHTPIEALFTNQLEFFRYVSLYVGGSLSNDDQIAPIAGAITIAIFLVLGVKAILERQKVAYFWIALGCFVLANAAMTGSGRFLLGAEQALASRYTSFSLFWLLAVVMLTIPYIRQALTRSTPWLQPVTVAGLVVIAALFVTTSLSGVTNARTKSLKDKTASACLNEEKTPDSACFVLVYPSNPDSDKRNTKYLEFLRDEHLAGRH